jgi:photosystem II stability/assembly factor-like uncharacterized protein
LSWISVNNGLPVDSPVRALAVIGTDLYAAIDGRLPPSYSGDRGGIFRSTDNGASWSRINDGLPFESDQGSRVYHVRALSTKGATVFAGVYDNVFHTSDDGVNWMGAPTGVDALSAIGTSLFASGGAGLFRSIDAGTTWRPVNDVNSTFLGWPSFHALAEVGSSIFAGGPRLFRSDDGGTTWTLVSDEGATALVVRGSSIFAAGGGVRRSSDGGVTWTDISNGLGTYPSVRALAVSGTYLFVGMNPGFGSSSSGVFRSTDDGQTWSETNSGLTNTKVEVLAVKGTDLFAATSGGGVFRSTDNGTSWSLASSGLPANSDVTAFAMDGGNLFAGTHSGVFLSTNDGASWASINTGLANTNVYSLTVVGRSLFACNYGAGVWIRQL